MKNFLLGFWLILVSNLSSFAQPIHFFEELFLERVWLSVAASNGNYNETLIAFKSDATLGVDDSYDAEKLMASESLSFYSKIGTENYAIQAVPSLLFDISVPLGINASSSGMLTLALQEENNFNAGAQVIIEDTKTGIFHNLKSEQSFNFQFDYLLDTLRFIAHFLPAPEFGSISTTCLGNDGRIFVNNLSNTPMNVSVYTADSSIIVNNQSVINAQEWTMLEAGIYFISFINEFGSMNNVAIELENALPISIQLATSSTTAEITNATFNFTTQLSDTEQILWDFGDGTIDSNHTEMSHTYLFPGIYTVNVIAGTPECQVFDSEIITVTDVITSIPKEEFSTINLNGNLIFNLNEKFNEIEISDLLGRRVYFQNLNNNQREVKLDLTNYRMQLLVINLIGNKQSFSKKICVN